MRVKAAISLCLGLLMLSCGDDLEVKPGEVNQLSVDGAVLPVHVLGNRSSRTALVVIHGGPGESAILKREAMGFFRLEKDHLLVYFDQRGSGIGEGNASRASLTVEQMALDLEAVVEWTSRIAGAESIFLVSLDWGAAVAAQYLASAAVSEKVRGYIAVSPAFNGPLTMQRSRQELLDIAEQLLNDGNAANDGPAANIVSFYTSNPVINRYNYREHYRLLEAVGGIIINADHPVSGAETPAYIGSLLEHNQRNMLEYWSTMDGHFLEHLNVEAELGDIRVPVKLIWGAWDRLMPLGMAQYYFDRLGDASSGELLSVFPASANRPYLEEGDRFYSTVATWMDFFD